MDEIEVRISWTGSGAELLQRVDDDEIIFPSSRAVFRADRSPIVFTYEGDPPGEGRLFEWILLFPEKTAKQLKAQVRFEGRPWHSLSKAKEKRRLGGGLAGGSCIDPPKEALEWDYLRQSMA